jgi:hypothetical protein
MQTETSTTKSKAHRTAIPAFAPVLRLPTGGSGIEVDDGLDIMVVGVKEDKRALGVFDSRLSTCAVGAGLVGDEAGRIRGVRTRVVVMSVELLAIKQSACLRCDTKRTTDWTVNEEKRECGKTAVRNSRRYTVQMQGTAHARPWLGYPHVSSN